MQPRLLLLIAIVFTPMLHGQQLQQAGYTESQAQSGESIYIQIKSNQPQIYSHQNQIKSTPTRKSIQIKSNHFTLCLYYIDVNKRPKIYRFGSKMAKYTVLDPTGR